LLKISRKILIKKSSLTQLISQPFSDLKFSIAKILKILFLEVKKHFLMEGNTVNVNYYKEYGSNVSFSELD